MSVSSKNSLLKNSIHYCIETLPSRTCTYTSVRNNIVSAACAAAPSDWGLLGVSTLSSACTRIDESYPVGSLVALDRYWVLADLRLALLKISATYM